MNQSFFPGHKKNQQLLCNLLQRGSVPEAFLFYGPENVGKSILAKLFGLSLILGLDQLASELLDHPDLKLLRLEEESKLHSIAKVKEFTEDVYLPPYEGKKKVFLIDAAHKMLPAASNALLKTLEEPATCSIMILLAPSLSEVLPTIASRCCKINFSPLADQEMVEYLMKVYQLSESRAQELVYESLDSLEYASMLHRIEGNSWKQLLFDLLKFPQELNYEEKLTKITELEKQLESEGPDFIEYFFDFLLTLFRDITLIKQGLNSFVHFQHQFKDLEILCHLLQGSFDFFGRILEELESSYRANIKLRYCLEVFFLRVNQEHAIFKASI